MKFTQFLYKHHIGKAVRYLWQHQRERSILMTKAENILRSMNFPIEDATKFILEQSQYKPKIIENSIKFNNINLKLEDKKYLIFEDHNVLQEGVPQACLLTKTLKINDELPKKIQNLITEIPDNINNLLKRFIYTSVIYDTQQIKLPRLKDPDRPAWVFPRVYGITATRKMHNLSKKFLQLCESLCGLNDAQNKSIVHDGLSSICLEKENYFIKFSLKMDIMMTSLIPLTPIEDVNMNIEFDLPDIYPLHYTIGLSKLNIFDNENLYPIIMESPFMNVHTIFINYNPEEVRNLTEMPVTEDQIHARSMIKSFTVAATCAQQRFGLNVKILPEPIVVQCIQSDGQNFHFSVYQLNTLDIGNKEGIKNFWWSEPSIKLYKEAQYEKGQPCLKDYNSDVFKRFFAFYKNK
ncbi:39S ribosomal protein L37 [Apis cerana cerana]|uniref:Large ribosomal subunit protein mL37 n=1 Tax=Apis cerana cerana TaxID=94128 RepID=A0A2A3E2E1_APICC|nr:39S ribosomal protein L37 [Apis cerana cerana]